MKKYLYAGSLAACLAVPAFATNIITLTQSPEQPLQRSAILLGVSVMLALQAFRYVPRLPARRLSHQDE